MSEVLPPHNQSFDVANLVIFLVQNIRGCIAVLKYN